MNNGFVLCKWSTKSSFPHLSSLYIPQEVSESGNYPPCFGRWGCNVESEIQREGHAQMSAERTKKKSPGSKEKKCNCSQKLSETYIFVQIGLFSREMVQQYE